MEKENIDKTIQSKSTKDLEMAQKDENIYTLRYALKPLMYLQLIFGVRRSLSKTPIKRKIYCLVTMVVIIAGAVYVLKGRHDIVYKDTKTALVATDILSLLGLVVTNICNIFISAFHSKSGYAKFYDNNTNIVEKLEINTTRRYKKGRIIVCTLIIVMLIPLVFICSYDFYINVTFHSIEYGLLYVINYIFILMNTLVCLQFILSLMLCRHGFLIANVKFATHFDLKYSMNEAKNLLANYEQTNMQNFVFHVRSIAEEGMESAKNNKCNIEELMKAFLLNCEQCELSNSFFKEQNLLMTINSIISLIKSLYLATSAGFNTGSYHMASSPHIISTCFFAMYDMMILYGITASCEVVVAEAKRFSRIIDCILFNCRSEDKEQLNLWSELSSRRIPCFTACNCFPINFTLLYHIGATVTTYLIILMQVKE